MKSISTVNARVMEIDRSIEDLHARIWLATGEIDELMETRSRWFTEMLDLVNTQRRLLTEAMKAGAS